MNRDDIQREFDRFFEFDTDDRRIVTSVSCRLFAEALVKMERQECADMCSAMTEAEYATGKVDHNEIAWTQKCAIKISERWKI